MFDVTWLRDLMGVLRATLLAACATASLAQPVAIFDEPAGLAWSEQELQTLAAPGLRRVVEHAAAAGLLGCVLHCEQIERVFDRLRQVAALHPGRAGAIAWRLIVVRLPDIDAFITPDGVLVVSEALIAQRQMHDAMLAFVLAHEMAHSILQHERQALTAVLALLPRVNGRTAQDVITELDHNGSMRRLAAPLFLQSEFDADEHGLLLAAAAGYRPDLVVEFMRTEARLNDAAPTPLASHPTASARLHALLARLPLAQAVWRRAGMAAAEDCNC